MYGGTSEKYILRVGANEPERIPSKFDNLKVEPGDRIIYRTAGSGGWGDPYERPAEEVARDVRHDLVSKEMAASRYGVVLTEAIEVDDAATEKTRDELRNARGEAPKFDFGPLPESIMAAAD